MVTSSNQPAVHEPVQVAEAYSYLASEQKEITLDSIPLPPTPPPLSASKDQESSSSNILEQTIIKQKRLARFKNTDLRRKILLKRTFDLVCEIMDHENGFDFEDETETIRDKRPQAPVSSKKEEADDEDSDDEEDESGSDSESDSSSDDSDSESDDSSSSSDDESDDEEEEEEPRSAIKCHDDTDIDQQIPKQNPVPSLCSQASDESSEDLDFTELNSVDITESYDDSAFNLDQVTYEPSSVSYEEPPVKTNLKRKRNSFEETVHQNEHDFYFGTSPSTCCETRNSDQELFCSNPPLGSLSDSTCFYNNQTTGLETPVKTLKRSLGDEAESSKRLKSN